MKDHVTMKTIPFVKGISHTFYCIFTEKRFHLNGNNISQYYCIFSVNLTDHFSACLPMHVIIH